MEGVSRGAYVLADAEGGRPDAAIVATGSEVHLAMEARERLAVSGVATRVVSAPSLHLFVEQEPAYRETVLPEGVPVVSVEAGVTLGWRTYLGDVSAAIGVDRFGASAPGEIVMRELGMTAESVVTAVQSALSR